MKLAGITTIGFAVMLAASQATAGTLAPGEMLKLTAEAQSLFGLDVDRASAVASAVGSAVASSTGHSSVDLVDASILGVAPRPGTMMVRVSYADKGAVSEFYVPLRPSADREAGRSVSTESAVITSPAAAAASDIVMLGIALAIAAVVAMAARAKSRAAASDAAAQTDPRQMNLPLDEIAPDKTKARAVQKDWY